MIRSGLCWGGNCTNGIGFWGPNGHDGIWHIAIIESLSRGSWEMPIFPPEVIRNYHIGYDLLVAIIQKITFIPTTYLQFQILPVLMALTVGVFVHLFIMRWTASKRASAWSLFFVYFGGGMGWILNLLRSGSLDGESVFWSQQSISTLINPPFALSLVVIFCALYLLTKGTGEGSRRSLYLSSILFGFLVQIKAYAGILALLSLLVSGLFFIYQKRDFRVFRVFTGALLISLAIFLPMNWGSESVIEFRPFWFIQTLFEFPDRLNWPRMASAIANYRLGGEWIKYISAVSVGTAIFIIGNFSTRVLSIFYLFKRPKKFDYLDVFFVVMIVFGLAIPLMFVQRGTVWNTIQFLYYSLIFSGVLSGVFISDFLSRNKSKITKITISSFVIIATIPTSFATLKYHYLTPRPPAMIPAPEIEALNFLSRQPQGIVLTQVFDPHKALLAQSNPPRPLYLYESTSYVSAYASKPVYLEDEVNLNITDFDWRTRRSLVEGFFENENEEFLKNNNIKYIYLLKNKEEQIVLNHKIIFENDQVVIIEI